MKGSKRRAREEVVDAVVSSQRCPHRQHRQRTMTNEGISWCWRSLLVLAVLTARCAESFQFAGPRTESRRPAPQQQLRAFIARQAVVTLPRTIKTSLLDSERQMDIDISFAKTAVVIVSNDTRSQQLLTERQLFNGFDSSSSTTLLESAADIAMPTENGGYSHTSASKAKISAANKGKTPWNKGQQRSEEVKAKIAAGVRAKNRERFLEKLAGMGLTEEEYEAQKKAERRKKDAERRERKTEKGGFRPTDETRQKISQVLREKYANGEIKRREVDPAKVRRGFVQSEETRQKISESLKKRWATDENYRETMRKKTGKVNTSDEVRQRISETLKLKWQDPEFRSNMLEKMRSRSGPKPALDKAHKDKISKAMKALWKDKEYRQKVVDSISKRAEISALEPKKTRKKKIQREIPRKPSGGKAGGGSFKTSIESILGNSGVTSFKSSSSSSSSSSLPTIGIADEATAMQQPMQPKAPVRRTKAELVKQIQSSISTTNLPKVVVAAAEVLPVAKTVAAAPPSPPPVPTSPPKKKKAVKKTKPTKPDSQPRTVSTSSGSGGGRTERITKITSTKATANGASAVETVTKMTTTTTTATKTSALKEDSGSVSRLREERRDLYDLLYGEEESGTPRTRSKLASIFELDDENLDTFDPYGLDDF